MATEQLLVTRERHGVETVEPKDFNIVWGDNPEYWRLPTQENPTAELLKVSYIDITAKVKLPQLAVNIIVIAFDVCKTEDSSGWETAEVKIGCYGNMGDYGDRDIMRQLSEMKPGERKEVYCNAWVDPSVAQTLHISFFDKTTKTLKKGMIFYGARVEHSY